ncbi:MAG: glycosyltransferase family 2 protein [Pseudomonadota bacterium]
MQLILDIRNSVQGYVRHADRLPSVLYRQDANLQRQLVEFAQSTRPRRAKAEPPEFIPALADAIASERPRILFLIMPGLADSLPTDTSVGVVRAVLHQLAADILIITDMDPASECAGVWATQFGADALKARFDWPDEFAAQSPAASISFDVPQFPRRFMPHNNVTSFDESQPMADTVPVETLPPEGSSGTVLIGCMKNEAPFLLEWIAYHLSVGVNHFVIYTNDCEDGTDLMLDALAKTGLVTHIINNNWKGNSPQQWALNQSSKLKVVKRADWLIHIDVDEFINIRFGNGTLPELYDRLPDGVSNIAMTWRQFGSAGIKTYEDQPVLAQFDRCAPSYLPKPHTAWGFKTATKNIGAYRKLSCHRPNKLREARIEQVLWVNGSGQDITQKMASKGWRSDIKTIGYDLVQLNHYALRSAQSFLVKRQRGRALHVDRSIGRDYWVRMDWNRHKDVSIQRNLRRLSAAMKSLMTVPEIAQLHAAAVAWHEAKIDLLMAEPEFRSLYDEITGIDLEDIHRIRAIMDADMQS